MTWNQKYEYVFIFKSRKVIPKVSKAILQSSGNLFIRSFYSIRTITTIFKIPPPYFLQKNLRFRLKLTLKQCPPTATGFIQVLQWIYIYSVCVQWIQCHRSIKWIIRWRDDITDALHMNLGKLWEMVRDRETRRAAVHGVKESVTTQRLNNNKFKEKVLNLIKLLQKQPKFQL